MAVTQCGFRSAHKMQGHEVVKTPLHFDILYSHFSKTEIILEAIPIPELETCISGWKVIFFPEYENDLIV